MSTHKQGFLRNVKLTANMLRLGHEPWPPFIGAGIHVLHIADDFARSRCGWPALYNRNYVGTTSAVRSTP